MFEIDQGIRWALKESILVYDIRQITNAIFRHCSLSVPAGLPTEMKNQFTPTRSKSIDESGIQPIASAIKISNVISRRFCKMSLIQPTVLRGLKPETYSTFE